MPQYSKKNMLFELTAAFYSLDFWFIMHTTDEDRLTEEYIQVLKCMKKKYTQNASKLAIRKNKHPQNFLYKNEKKTKPQFRLP